MVFIYYSFYLFRTPVSWSAWLIGNIWNECDAVCGSMWACSIHFFLLALGKDTKQGG